MTSSVTAAMAWLRSCLSPSCSASATRSAAMPSTFSLSLASGSMGVHSMSGTLWSAMNSFWRAQSSLMAS